jgi:hypothetical protein
MISHEDAILGLRAKVVTLSVVTTGSTSISATATDYQRAAGSFITDGFRIGMEVEGTGFSNSENNDPKVITAVATLTLTCAGNVAESAGTRTVSVGLPSTRVWENSETRDENGVPSSAVAGTPYFTEEYLPGPAAVETLGDNAQIEVFPQYVPRVYVPANQGAYAALKYADALLTLFAPKTVITIATADSSLRVRGDVAPFSGQIVQSSPGWAVVPITVPLRLRTANSI